MKAYLNMVKFGPNFTPNFWTILLRQHFGKKRGKLFGKLFYIPDLNLCHDLDIYNDLDLDLGLEFNLPLDSV